MSESEEFDVSENVKNKYSNEDLERALSEVFNGTTVYAASKKYGVPESTLRFRKNAKGGGKQGRKLMLNEEIETEISDWIIKCSQRGAPKTKEQLMEAVGQIRKRTLKDPTASLPSNNWVKNFMQRNPQLSYRMAQAVTRSSACVSEADIRRWFAMVSSYLVNENIFHLTSEPCRWINCDESGFELNPKPGRVLAAKGTKNVNFIETAHPSERVSVMYTFGADGHVYRPQIIMKNSVSRAKLLEMTSASVGEYKTELIIFFI